MRTLVAAALAAAVGLLSCRDFEQRARATGARVRDEIATRCSAEAAKADAGFEVEETCADERCRAACSGDDVAKGFSATCVAECRSLATCATDADCRSGLRCVAVAPRVRRCGSSSP